jgi:hypothetical protein
MDPLSLDKILLFAEPQGKEEVKLQISARCVITGKFKPVIELQGNQEDWSLFMKRLGKQLNK